jgi:hypothetical protein
MKYVVFVLLVILYVWFVPEKFILAITLLCMSAWMFYHDYRVEALEKKYDGLVEGCSRMRDQVEDLAEESRENTLAQIRNQYK